MLKLISLILLLFITLESYSQIDHSSAIFKVIQYKDSITTKKDKIILRLINLSDSLTIYWHAPTHIYFRKTYVNNSKIDTLDSGTPKHDRQRDDEEDIFTLGPKDSLDMKFSASKLMLQQATNFKVQFYFKFSLINNPRKLISTTFEEVKTEWLDLFTNMH